MKNPEAVARLEALLARVSARKSQPRGHDVASVTEATPAASPPKAPSEARTALSQLFEPRATIDINLHPPLSGDGSPEIDMFERTMDFDIATVDRALSSMAEPALAQAELTRPTELYKPRAPEAPTAQKAPSFQSSPFRARTPPPEPRAPQAPVAPQTPAAPEQIEEISLEAEESEVPTVSEAPAVVAQPIEPAVVAQPIEPAAVAQPIEPAVVPQLIAPAVVPQLIAPAVVPQLVAPAVVAQLVSHVPVPPVLPLAPPTEPEEFSPRMLETPAQAVRVLPLAPPTAPSFRDLLSRSLALKPRSV